MTTEVRRFRLREWLTMSLWVAPAGGVLVALALSQCLVALDHAFVRAIDRLPLIDAGADGAQTMLSVIAGSMVTSISLIFSVTMVVLQLASAQYSPRVLAGFIRDRFVQAVFAAYIGTFVYALLVLPTVHAGTSGDEEFVPDLAVTGALVLALASLGLFVRFVHHVAHAIRGVTIINKVAADTRDALEVMYPEDVGRGASGVALPGERPTAVVPWPSPPGVLVAVDEQSLMEIAARDHLIIALRRRIGEFVPTHGPLFDVYGPLGDAEELRACATVGAERTMHQDAAFGIRQLVDIAERALSPGVNDPTTAVQCIDQLHDLLRRLAVRGFPSPFRVSPAGDLRVVAPTPDWNDYVHLAFDEIRHYSGRSVQVARRLVEALEDLLEISDPDRHPPIRQQLDLLQRSVEREFDDAPDQRAARA